MEIALTQIIGPALVIGLRVSGLVLFAPFFGSAVIPPRIKAVLVIAITAVLYPVYSPHLHAVTMSHWPVLVASETVVGIAMGLATNAVFEGAQMAGQVLSMQMGYSLVNILDPNSQIESTVVAFFHQSLAMLIFLGLDVHHWILRAVVLSFE
jgi:flagellar biosynthetic protein FliR